MDPSHIQISFNVQVRNVKITKSELYNCMHGHYLHCLTRLGNKFMVYQSFKNGHLIVRLFGVGEFASVSIIIDEVSSSVDYSNMYIVVEWHYACRT